MADEFVRDMEQGQYAPPTSNAIRRLNDVTRRWEAMLNDGTACDSDDDTLSFISTDSQEEDIPSPPPLRRQNASEPVRIPQRSTDEGAMSYATAVQWGSRPHPISTAEDEEHKSSAGSTHLSHDTELRREKTSA